MITQSVTVVQGQGLVWGTPKSHERREVPIPRFLVDDLAAHVAGKGPEELVFSGVRSGGVLRVAVSRYGAFDAAAAAIGEPGLHPHELRHTAASLAIASGADVKVVQQMLGHSSATMTMDTYGHLFENRLDDVAEAMDAARSAARSTAQKTPDSVQRADAALAPADCRVSPVVPPTDLVDLDEVRAKGKAAGQRGFSKGAPGRIRTYATASGGRCSIP
jgi:hypothetical protein